MPNVKVPRTSVYVAYPTSGNVRTEFHRSIWAIDRWEALQGFNNLTDELVAISGANISKARNQLVEEFLDTTDGEWLWFVDPDMVMKPDTLARLLCSAQLADAKVIGALCCMVTQDGPIPTIYQLGNLANGEVTRVMLDYPDGTILQVAATGTGCLLIHRSALEAIREKSDRKFPWFYEDEINGNWVSEDLMFTLKANEHGFQVYVDCTTPVGHHKFGKTWWPEDIRKAAGFPDQRTYVVIPVKDRLDLTRSLIEQLRAQAGYEQLIICDNGSGQEMKNWLKEQDDITTLDMPDAGIHEMWNAGADVVMAHGQKRNTNIAFLNNDIEIGPDFLASLVTALRSRPKLVAVCPNYDGRSIEGHLELTQDICANRYDGTGGLAGFAFMVRGEWFLSGYRFPEECKWWHGDNDLVMAITQVAQGEVGITGNTTVVHVDGGGQTGDWCAPEMQPQLAADKAAFEERWQRITAEAKARQEVAA